MLKMLNCCNFNGRLVADPERRTTTKGDAIATFRIAVDRDYQKQGEERRADFIPVVTFSSTAEFVCKYFHKGDMICITGALESDNYTDKAGEKKTSYKVQATRVSFCGGKKSNTETETQPEAASPESYDDELPF